MCDVREMTDEELLKEHYANGAKIVTSDWSEEDQRRREVLELELKKRLDLRKRPDLPTEEQLKEKYPELLGNVHIGVGPGWMGIIDKIARIIEFQVKYNKMVRPRVQQIKEKFGILRFYIGWDEGDQPDDHRWGSLHGAINTLENIAGETCEDCGRPGETRPGGWIRCLCDHCDNITKIQGRR